MNSEEIQQINLDVLRTLDRSTRRVIATSANVSLFKYNQPDSNWVQTDVHGTLLLYERCDPKEAFGAQLLSHNSRNDFITFFQGIDKNLIFNHEKSLITIRTGASDCVGLWFSNGASQLENFIAQLERLK